MLQGDRRLYVLHYSESLTIHEIVMKSMAENGFHSTCLHVLPEAITQLIEALLVMSRNGHHSTSFWQLRAEIAKFALRVS